MGQFTRGVGVGLALWAAQGAIAIAAPADRGHRIAVEVCLQCHAVGAVDESMDPHAPPFRSLRVRLATPAFEEALAAAMRTGHRGMPPFSLNAAQVSDLIAYIVTVQTHDQASLGPPRGYAGGPSSRWSSSTRAASPAGSSY
jgi:cytochrome c